MKNGTQLIAEERHRQIEREGWTSEHDDQHKSGELSDAATEYAIAASSQARGLCGTPRPTGNWPFEMRHWKPSQSCVRNLVKAGALIAAEIDRILRSGYAANSGYPTPNPFLEWYDALFSADSVKTGGPCIKSIELIDVSAFALYVGHDRRVVERRLVGKFAAPFRLSTGRAFWPVGYLEAYVREYGAHPRSAAAIEMQNIQYTTGTHACAAQPVRPA